MRSLSALPLVGLLLCCTARAQMTSRPVVLELFTSQGCSSCPPAEVYVGELHARKDVLALSFHVDYWDDLGWKDPFSLAASTQRQEIYSATKGRASVYTPQVVIDGGRDFIGTDRRNIGEAIATPRSGVPVDISLQGPEVIVDVGSQETARSADVLMVIYLREASTAIGRGENAGRRLVEHNIVRGIRSLGQWRGDAVKFRTSRSLLPRDGTDVAIIVQSARQQGIIGAATRALH